MKALNLYEWAQALYLSGDAEAQEYAKEIMDTWGAADELDELKNSILYQVGKAGCEHTDPEKQIEWLGDRSDTLEIIKDILHDNQMELCIDPDDTVRGLVNQQKQMAQMIESLGFEDHQAIDTAEAFEDVIRSYEQMENLLHDAGFEFERESWGAIEALKECIAKAKPAFDL